MEKSSERILQVFKRTCNENSQFWEERNVFDTERIDPIKKQIHAIFGEEDSLKGLLTL